MQCCYKLFRYPLFPYSVFCVLLCPNICCVCICVHIIICLYVCSDIYTQNLKAAFYMCVCACHIHIFMINTEW